ncbi:hypothetical protein B0I35DRAFT_17943 [Stachybotrys elegans]|uniref:Uncharacterized protein n=1 Tax=Stachybotrys elegans TaxID=80388 RepID=A0A8K0T5G1_9HYPO|nr:hypothetical protein B0I35DRAFT_17943 [Stachybotrys elegans]
MGEWKQDGGGLLLPVLASRQDVPSTPVCSGLLPSFLLYRLVLQLYHARNVRSISPAPSIIMITPSPSTSFLLLRKKTLIESPRCGGSGLAVNQCMRKNEVTTLPRSSSSPGCPGLSGSLTLHSIGADASMFHVPVEIWRSTFSLLNTYADQSPVFFASSFPLYSFLFLSSSTRIITSHGRRRSPESVSWLANSPRPLGVLRGDTIVTLASRLVV